jgi:hypothetical protein
MKDNLKGKAPASKPATGAVGDQVPAGKSREKLEREALEEVARDLWEEETLRQISEGDGMAGAPGCICPDRRARWASVSVLV